MNFQDGALRLKILKYEWIEYPSRQDPEIHFIHKDHVQQYLSYPPLSQGRRHTASYIFNAQVGQWVKERSPLDAMPLTETERILFGLNK